MFHMLSCFNLRPDTSLPTLQRAVTRFSEQLLTRNLLMSTSPIGKRQRHPIMDTDAERNLEYYFIMSFRDREQCDLAVAHINEDEQPGGSFHTTIHRLVADAVFICWEDVA